MRLEAKNFIKQNDPRAWHNGSLWGKELILYQRLRSLRFGAFEFVFGGEYCSKEHDRVQWWGGGSWSTLLRPNPRCGGIIYNGSFGASDFTHHVSDGIDIVLEWTECFDASGEVVSFEARLTMGRGHFDTVP